MTDEKDEIMDAKVEVIEKPKGTVVKDLTGYLKNLKFEMNIQKYEYMEEEDAGTKFVSGIRLYVSVIGVVKPVDVKFSELGFTETRLPVDEVDKIFNK